MDQMPWILGQLTGGSSSMEASGDRTKNSNGKQINGWLCLQIRLVLVRAIGRISSSGRQQVSETLTSTQSRTTLIPSVTIATRRATFHPSAQREKEKGGITMAKERVETDIKEKATASFSPTEDGIRRGVGVADLKEAKARARVRDTRASVWGADR